MSNRTIKIGSNCERHIGKYGTSVEDYIEFSKRTARKVTISRYDTDICTKFRIYTISHLTNFPTELPDLGINEQEYTDYLFENTKNPYEIAKLWLCLKGDAEGFVSNETIIAEHLPAFPKEDFERWGDKNWLTDVSKTWFKKDSINLDVKVEEINTQVGSSITVDECIEFVKKYRPNTYKNPIQLKKEELEARFKEITGFNIKDYYAEHLIKSCEFSILDTTEVPF